MESCVFRTTASWHQLKRARLLRAYYSSELLFTQCNPIHAALYSTSRPCSCDPAADMLRQQRLVRQEKASRANERSMLYSLLHLHAKRSGLSGMSYRNWWVSLYPKELDARNAGQVMLCAVLQAATKSRNDKSAEFPLHGGSLTRHNQSRPSLRRELPDCECDRS